MHILVIAATKFEIEPFIAGHKPVEISIPGVGVPSTLYQLQKNIYIRRPDLIIQAGIAGSFTSDVPLSKVVLVKQDVFADIGIEEKGKFTPVVQTGLADKDVPPFTNGWLVNPSHIFSMFKLPAVKAITVNKVSDSVLQKQQAINNFAPQIESMEGAALHYVCLQENIPFIQIRSISNKVGERDKSKWKMEEAISNLNTELLNLIDKITNEQEAKCNEQISNE